MCGHVGGSGCIVGTERRGDRRMGSAEDMDEGRGRGRVWGIRALYKTGRVRGSAGRGSRNRSPTWGEK